MNDRLDRTLQNAIAAGLLPADVRRPDGEGRPWPVVLLIAVGAWFAAIPLLGVVAVLLGDWVTRDLGPYLIGALVLALAVVVLRSRDLPLFIEQLAVPALLVGLGSLGFGLFRDLSVQGGAAWLTVVALGLATVLTHAWLRVLLGAAAACLFVLGLLPGDLFGRQGWAVAAWLALHGAVAAWLAGLWVQEAVLRGGGKARAAAALESIGAGWLLGTLAGLALVTGMSFLVGASLDPMARDFADGLTSGRAPAAQPSWMSAGSTLLVLAATLWGGRVWPGLRRPWVLGVGVAAAGLAWFLPNLGGAWLALVLMATTWRWRLATAAALAVIWMIGSFYYQLQWPLATKALVLVAAGALLGLLAAIGSRFMDKSAQRKGGSRSDGGAEEEQPSRRSSARMGAGQAWSRWAIALTALATLLIVNFGIWDKETLIAHGRPVFVELAPVDPRSLMQGDFMRLAFRVPGQLQTELGVPTGERRLVVARLDGRGVATLLRLASAGEVSAEPDMLLALVPKGGRWGLGSDAWYFQEGDGQRWQAARYGEFRVAADGRALLVGMADAELHPIAR